MNLYSVNSIAKLHSLLLLISLWSNFASSSKSPSSILKNPLSPGTPKRNLNRKNLSQSTFVPSTSSQISRGGASMWTSQTTKELSGALVFVILDKLFRSAFNAKKITFPSPAGGCIITLASLVLAESVKPGSGEMVFQALSPGAAWLAKWLPVFFVPGLAGLPLAPSIGSSLEVLKVLGLVIIGFFFTLTTSAFSVLTVRKLQGATNVAPAVARSSSSTPTASPTKPYSPQLVQFLYTAVPIAAAISMSTSKINHPLAQPLNTLFMALTTVSGFVWGARLPEQVTKLVHPLVSSTVITLLITYVSGLVLGTSFIETLRKYKVGSLFPMTAGAGDYILYMLGPAVVSFAWPMFSRRFFILQNFLPVSTSMLVASIGGLFGTAAFVRLINLGGERIGSSILRRSVLPRNVTTALAMAISKILGGDMSITACCVIATGIFGATFGARILTALGVYDPVARGLSIGAAAQGLGTASLINEKEAFPFAAISMILTAVSAATLTSIPVIKSALLRLAGGN